MTETILKCGKCGADIIKDYGLKQKLRANILIWEDGQCIAKCHKCKCNVNVPVKLDTSTVSEKKIGKIVNSVF